MQGRVGLINHGDYERQWEVSILANYGYGDKNYSVMRLIGGLVDLSQHINKLLYLS